MNNRFETTWQLWMDSHLPNLTHILIASSLLSSCENSPMSENIRDSWNKNAMLHENGQIKIQFLYYNYLFTGQFYYLFGLYDS